MPRPVKPLQYEKVFKNMTVSDLNNLIDEAKTVIKRMQKAEEEEKRAAMAESLIKKLKLGMTATYSKGKGKVVGITQNDDDSYSVQLLMNGRRRKVALTKIDSVE
jgi:hypothetical protein